MRSRVHSRLMRRSKSRSNLETNDAGSVSSFSQVSPSGPYSPHWARYSKSSHLAEVLTGRRATRRFSSYSSSRSSLSGLRAAHVAHVRHVGVGYLGAGRVYGHQRARLRVCALRANPHGITRALQMLLFGARAGAKGGQGAGVARDASSGDAGRYERECARAGRGGALVALAAAAHVQIFRYETPSAPLKAGLAAKTGT